MAPALITPFVHTILILSETYFVLLVFLAGYYFLNKDVFAKAAILVVFTMTFNPFLKSIFQVPLPPTLVKDVFAFPSGHEQLSFVLWASIAYDFKKPWLYAVASCIIASIGFALVYAGYHWPTDIPAAILFGALSLIFVNYIQFKYPIFNKKLHFLSFLMALIALPMFLQIPFTKNYSHAWYGLGALLGFGLGWLICEKLNIVSNTSKLFATINVLLSLVCIILIEIIFKQFSLGFPFHGFALYFVIAFTLIGIIPILAKFVYKALPFKKKVLVSY